MTEVARARWLVAAGAATTVAGLALAGTVEPAFGLVVVVGWVVLGLGVHRFGRAE